MSTQGAILDEHRALQLAAEGCGDQEVLKLAARGCLKGLDGSSWADALRYAAEARKPDPADDDCYVLLSTAWLRYAYAGDWEFGLLEATEVCEDWVRMHPRNARAHSMLGSVYELRDRWEQALICYEMADALEPDNPVVLYRKALALHELHYPEAAEAFRRVLELDPKHAKARLFFAGYA